METNLENDHTISLDVLSLATKEEQDDIIKLISHIHHKHPDASGWIIATIDEKGEAESYWDGDDFFKFKGSHMEDPKTYKTCTGLQKVLVRLRLEHKNLLISVCFWWHPDIGIPLERYLKMTGFQFPGSPTQ